MLRLTAFGLCITLLFTACQKNEQREQISNQLQAKPNIAPALDIEKMANKEISSSSPDEFALRLGNPKLEKTMPISSTKIILKKGDITKEQADIIVNAANNELEGRGGIDGAIHRVGGPEISHECDEIRKTQGRCPAGQAVITTAGQLSASKVIHAVGPIWQGGNQGEDDLLRSAYLNSLALAIQYKAKIIAFPSISTGAYGFPIERASFIALKAAHDFIEKNKDLEEIRFILFSEKDFKIYESVLKQVKMQSMN